VVPRSSQDAAGRTRLSADVTTELGTIAKSVTFDPGERAVEISWTLHWLELPMGSLRIGHVTLHPEAFDRNTLWFGSHNGGEFLERHGLGDERVEHGAPVSALVSPYLGHGHKTWFVATVSGMFVNFFLNKFRKLGFIGYDAEGLTIHPSLLSIVVHD